MARSDRGRILAFRVAAHNLDRRLPRGSLVEAAATSGIRTTPRDASVLAGHARLEDFTRADIDRALEDKTLVEVLSARGTAAIVPAADVSVFTLGLLPSNEQSLRHVLRPVLPVLDAANISAERALELSCDVAREVLADGPLTWGELSGALTRRLPELSPMCRGRCKTNHIDDGLFRLVGVSGLWCYRPAGDHEVVRIDQWLGSAPSRQENTRAEALRRYLRCHGPSTSGAFAAWAGISPADARGSFAEIVTELVEVRVVDGKTAWILDEDVDRLSSPRGPDGARLLPAGDPYLMSRDRETLVPDAATRQRVWRAQTSPGAVLVGSEIVGTWRTRRKGKGLEITIEPFGKISKQAQRMLESEADGVASLRGYPSAAVLITE